MIAIDTNVLVRWITRDDATQVARTDAIMAQPVHVSLTVLLELAWVLGGRTYRYDRATVAKSLLLLLDVTTVSIPSADDVRWAIERFSMGGDIADMLHIVSVRGSTAFVSFEHGLAERAGAATPVPIRQP